MQTILRHHMRHHATPVEVTNTVASSASQRTLRVLRAKDVINKLGIARSTLYDWMSPTSPRYDETFPKHFKIGQHCVGWFEHQLDEWLVGKAMAE